MANSNLINRCWTNFKERMKARWTGLQDSDLDAHQGDFNQLAENVHERFQDSRDVVKDYVDQLWFEIYVRGARQTLSFSQEEQEVTAIH